MRYFKHSSFDRLEARICLHSGEHESQIDSAYISTHHGNVPNLAHPQFAEGRAIHMITESGDFSAILANHPISDNDIVVVQGHVVYDLSPAADFSVHTLAVDSEASIEFRTDIDTSLEVVNLLILEHATVTIGTPTDPLPAHINSEIVISDAPINVNLDAEQFGHGILVFGNLQMHGAPLAHTFAKLAQDVHAGETAINLQQPMWDWRVGDTIFLPDTRQATLADLDDYAGVRGVKYPQWEEVTIAGLSADGMVITLTQPLAYDHVGARNPVTGQQEDFNGDGDFDLMPHAANETRNITVRSADPIGTRGHFAAFERSQVDLRYVHFDEFGRTTVSPVDSTIKDAAGNVTHIGTNQIGRYALHFHHVRGVPSPSSGYTVQVVGCAVTDSQRWGIVLHDTSWSNVSHNVVLRADGAGIVTEDGSDAYNTITHNFVGVSAGDGNTEDSIAAQPGVVGFHGYGLWLSGVQNSVIDHNVLVNHAAAGMNLNFQAGSGGPLVRVPRFPGADISVAGEYDSYRTGHQLPTSIAHNEFYGAMMFGFESWTLVGGPDTIRYATDERVLSGHLTVADSLAWHIHGAASRQGYGGNHSIDGLVARNKFNDTVLADHQSNLRRVSTQGVLASRVSSVLKNFDIQGFSVGIQTHQFSAFDNVGKFLMVEDGNLVNYINVRASDITTGDREQVIINDVVFGALPNYPLTAFTWQDDFAGWFQDADANHYSLDSSRSEFYIRNYNRVPGDDYKLYRDAQNPFYIYSLDDGDHTAQQLWDYRQFAVLGELSPCSDVACSNADSSHPEFQADTFATNDDMAAILPTRTIDGVYHIGYGENHPFFTAQYVFVDSDGERYNVQRQFPVAPGENTAVLQELTGDGQIVNHPLTIYVDGVLPTAEVQVTGITTDQAVVQIAASEPVSVSVRYIVAGNTEQYFTTNFQPHTAIPLSNLSPGVTYDIDVVVADRSGNGKVSSTSFTTAFAAPHLSIDNLLPGAVVEAPLNIGYRVEDGTGPISYIAWRLGSLQEYESVLDGHHQFPVVPSGDYLLTAYLIGNDGARIGGEVTIPLTVSNVDTSEPFISDVETVDVAEGSVRIRWTTSELATTQITVGGRTVTGDSSLTSFHELVFDALHDGERMSANIQSLDGAGNLAERFIYFAAGQGDGEPQPPVISDLTTMVTASSAIMTWTTDQLADTTLDFAGYDSASVLIRSQQPSLLHVVEFIGLAPGSTYHLNIYSANAAGSATEHTHIFTPSAPAFIDLAELAAISQFGGDIRRHTANLLQLRFSPAAADAAMTAPAPSKTAASLRSSRSKQSVDRVLAEPMDTSHLRGRREPGPEFV